MPYFTYILYSEKLDRYYIGSTEDIQKRLEAHNAGRSNYTRKGKPWVLKHTEVWPDKKTAQDRERFIKNKKSRVFIEQLIRTKAR